MIEAIVIADSISREGKRLTTVKLRYPKFVHGELMTHRAFSRNASSSRAIPTAKLIEEVRSDVLRAAPVFWGKNQSGMSAAEELDDSVPWRKGWTNTARSRANQVWASAALEAVRSAEFLVEVGAHKQIVNRILEPFSHINVLVTATEWDNFFGLRLDAGAQPEMRALAESIWVAREASTPILLAPGEWHLPFVEGSFAADVADWLEGYQSGCDAEGIRYEYESWEDLAIRVSVARAARVSYESFETGKRSTVEEDLKLYDRLVGSTPIHASPAEHQATPDYFAHQVDGGGWANAREHGNFIGWRQFRKTLSGESCAPLPKEYARAS